MELTVSLSDATIDEKSQDVTIEISLDDIFREIDDHDLALEAHERGLTDDIKFDEPETTNEWKEISTEQMRRKLCDWLEIGYHTHTIEQIADLLKQKLS